MSAKLKHTIKAINKAALVYGSISTLALGAALTQAQQAPEGLMEEIEVTGIRSSLKQAMDTKRFSNTVVDAISAEDIGKFPDKNVADALVRIPGVTIERTFGEGANVSVRGLSPDLTKTMLNGQYVASTGWFTLDRPSRSFNFELMASEMVSGLEVYKSPEASLDEGGIGGTIVMKTRKPLDLDAWTVYGSVEAQYSELPDEWDPSVSGMVSWKNDAETFGVLAAYANQQRTTERHSSENYWTWGNGNAVFQQERERESTDITVQWAPTDALDITGHYFNAEMQANNQNSNLILLAANGNLVGTGFSPNVDGSTTPTTGTVFTDNDPTTPELVQNPFYREAVMETSVYDLNVEYEGNGYTLHAQVGKTESDGGSELEFGSWWSASSDANFQVDSDSVGHTFTDVDVTDANAYTSQFAGSEARQSPAYDDETYYQLDAEFEVSFGPISSLETGLKVRDHETGREPVALSFNNPNVLNGLSLAQFSDGVSESLSGNVSNSATTDKFIIPDQKAFWDYLKGQTSITATPNKGQFYKLQEDINSAYVQANFEGENYRGNVGVRYTETDLTADSFNGDTPTVSKNSYSDWLPSINLALDLSDDVIFRAAAAGVMSRPSYSDLNPAFSAPNPTLQQANQGNPELDPFRANQYDLGLEWYYGDASMTGITFFHKDIKAFVGNEQVQKFVNDPNNPGVWTITQASNGSGGSVQGIEAQIQHDFGNGFGLTGNYTYSDSDLDSGEALPGNSQNSYNVSAYYENDYISTRLAYNYRSEFTNPGNNTYLDEETGFLDASFVWHVTDYLDLSADAINLTEESSQLSRKKATNRVAEHYDNGRRFILGAKVKF